MNVTIPLLVHRRTFGNWGIGRRLAAMALVAGLVAFTSEASAQVTYNLTQYVAADNSISATDTFSGTFTLSSPGTYTTSSDSVTLTYTLTISSTGGSPITASGSVALSSAPFFGGTLAGTGSTLTLSSNGGLEIEAGGGTVGIPYVQADWDPADQAVALAAGIQGDAATYEIFNNVNNGHPVNNANFPSGSTWTLGTAVPEPGSAVLAMIGGVGMLLARRRRAV